MNHTSILDQSIATRICKKLVTLSLGLSAGVISFQSAHAAVTRIWDGGGTGGTNMETLANWSGDVLPNGTNSDTAQWNGTVAGNLSLTYTALTANGLAAGNGNFLDITAGQTSSLTINEASGTAGLRVQNITIANGAGAFTFGSSDAILDTITLGSATVVAHTFTNNSSNTATFGTDARLGFGGGVAKTVTFGGSGNWLFGAKFGVSGTGSVTSISKTGAGTLTINNNIQGTNSGSVAVNPGSVFVNAGAITLTTGGVVTTTGFNSIGVNTGDVGTMNLINTGSFTSGTDFNVGDVGSSSGTLNVQNTAALTVNTGGGLFVGSANGAGSTASGIVNQSGGTVNVNATADGRFVLGGRNAATTGGSGTYNLSLGTVTNAANAWIGGYGTGTFTQTGGTFNNTGFVSIGRQTGSAGTYTISAGALNQTGANASIIVGEAGTGTLLVSGTGAVATPATGTLRLGNSATGNGTVNLNGGTITTQKVETAGGTSTFNFNGGTLTANVSSMAFLQGLTTANVRNNGALINTSTFNVTIGQALLHSGIGGDNAIDGGLTKSGSGTLTLSGANTYKGTTAINTGSVIFAGSSLIGNISLADSTTLGAKVTNVGTSVIGSTNNPNLTFGTAGATSFAMDFNVLGNPTVPVINMGSGVLTLNGTVTVSLANTSALTTTPNNTTLALFNYGSQAGAGAFNLTTTSAGHTTFALNPTATILYLSVSANPVTWTAGVSNQWNTSTLSSPKNWVLADTTQTDFISGDTVMFTNTASSFAVDVTENITPGVVTFSNTSNAYSISSTGGFGLTAGSISVSGSGTVTINNANTYAGGTSLNSGKLVINNASAIGTGTLTIAGGNLDATSATVLSTNGAQAWNSDFTFDGTANLDLGSGAVTVGGAGTNRVVTVTASTLTVGELRAPGQGIDKQGAGTLVLASTGTNAGNDASIVSGVLNVGAGTIQISRTGTDAANSGDLTVGGLTGTGTVTDGAAVARTLYVNTTGTYDFPGTLTNGGAGGLGFTKQGSGTQTLSGANNYTGATTVSGGVLNITGSLNGTAITVAAGATFTESGASSITNAGSLTVSGTATLNGNNTYAGTTTLNTNGNLTLTGSNSTGGPVNITNGILHIQNSNALGTSLVTSTSRNGGIELQGNITLPSTVTFITSNDGTSGALVPYAIDNLSGNNTINGTITLTSGGGGSIIQSESGSLTVAGNITIAAAQTTRGIFLQGASTGANTFSGVLSDLSGTALASIGKNGTGTWTVSGANTYSGGTIITGGTLNATSNSALGSSTVATTGVSLTPASGTATLDFTSATPAIGSLASSGAGTSSVVLGNATAPAATALTAGANNTTTTFAGTLSDLTGTNAAAIGSLTKTGTGTLTLSGTAANTYTGPTTISGGTLALSKTAGVNGVPGDVTITGTGQLSLLAGEQVPDTATITVLGTNNDSVLTSAAVETVANVVVNSSTLGAAGGQIVMRNGFTVTGTATLTSGVLGVGSGNTATVNAVNITAATGTSNGILRISGNTGSSTLNIGTGGITASGGEIQVKINTNNFDATLNLGGDVTTTGDVTFTNAGYTGANLNVINLTGTRNFNIGASTTTTVNPDIAGIGGLTKTGNGTLALTSLAAATYTGDTTISAGTLLIHGTISGTSKVDVTGTLGGTGTITPISGGNVNILTGGKLSPGASVGTLNTVLSGGGALDLTGGVSTTNSQALVFELDSVATSDKVTLTGGALKIGTGVLEFDDFNFTTLGSFATDSTYVLFQGDTAIDGTLGPIITGAIGGFTGQLQFADSGTDLVLVVVPEPGTVVTLLGGLGLLVARRRRRSS